MKRRAGVGASIVVGQLRRPMVLHVTSAAEADALCTSATMRGDTFTVEETRAGVWTFAFASLQRTVPRSAHPLSYLEN